MNKYSKQVAEKKGRLSEELAEKALLSKGYQILFRRYKTPHGEIDLITQKEELLAIVEVKHRSNLEKALESFTPYQQRRVAAATQFFLNQYPAYNNFMIRFDFIAVCPYKEPKHFENIWEE